MTETPRQIVEKWVAAFNAADTDLLESLYAEDAINHQMPNYAVAGRTAIGDMFRWEFSVAPAMHCMPVQIMEDGNMAAMEWKDPKGFRGCGFFEINNGLIQAQRGYWDRLTFEKLYGI